MPCKQMLLKHIATLFKISISDIIWNYKFNLFIFIHIFIFVIIFLVKILDSGVA